MRNNKKTRRNHKNINEHKKIKKQNKFIFYFLFLLIIILIAILGIIFSIKTFINNSNNGETESNLNGDISETTQTQEDTTFTITALGDILCHNTQYMDAYNKTTGTYDFDYAYENVKHYTQLGDLTIANIETSFAGAERGYSNYPTFNSPDALANSMKNIGVDIITTAGNHALDMGFSGLSRTIDTLDKADISHLGTYKSQEERDSVFIKYVKGVKIAFIDYTYGTNGIPVPSGKDFCINIINKDLIKSDIDKAKEQSPDVIIACMHWGTEYKTSANSDQKDLADFLFQNGVDVILGNHPHVLEQMEKRTVTLSDGSNKDGFVIYALGNFCADQTDEITRDSIILNLSITKHADGKISIDHAKYTPIYFSKKMVTTNGKIFKSLDLEKTIADYDAGVDTSIGSTNYQKLKTQLEKIKSIVGNEF